MIGVTGASGEIGRRLAHRLAARSLPTRLIARDMSRVPSLPQAERARTGGYGDATGMRQALEGISTLFLCSARESPDRVEQHRTAVQAAVDAGVERLVYLSFVGAARDATFTFARHHFETEQLIRASGLAFTFSRQNLYLDLAPLIAGNDGVIRGPAGAGRLVPVLRDDVADALAVLVAEPGHDGKTYDLSGLEPVTLEELATALARASGRPFSYVDETLEQARESRAGYGAPAWELEGWITTYTAIAAGELDVVTDHVARLTGHPPVAVDEYLDTLSW